jgi:hypothetical protein
LEEPVQEKAPKHGAPAHGIAQKPAATGAHHAGGKHSSAKASAGSSSEGNGGSLGSLDDADADSLDEAADDEGYEDDQPAQEGQALALYKPLVGEKGRKRPLKVIGIAAASFFGLVLLVYLAGTVFFIDRLWPQTTMVGYDLSLKSKAEAATALEEAVLAYRLDVEGLGLMFSLGSQEVGLAVDEEAVLTQALRNEKPWMWPFEVFKAHDESGSFKAAYQRDLVQSAVAGRIEEFNLTATPPTDAYVAFDKGSRTFKVVPEELGTAIDARAVESAIGNELAVMGARASLTRDELVFPLISEGNTALRDACVQANAFITTDVKVTMGGFAVTDLGPELMSSWVSVDAALNVSFNEEACAAWIEMLVAGCNTIDTERTYTRPDGKEITVEGGSYGWEADDEALRAMVREAVATGMKGTLEVPVLQSGSGYGSLGGRDWGNRYCDIDLAEQYARFYDDTGALVWESPVITGAPWGGRATPAGVFMCNTKASPSKLVGEPLPGQTTPEYETWVTYWMPFVGNAIGLHDATWQPSGAFGGSSYANGYGSHGCVNLPYSAAEALFAIIEPGDPVISHW